MHYWFLGVVKCSLVGAIAPFTHMTSKVKANPFFPQTTSFS